MVFVFAILLVACVGCIVWLFVVNGTLAKQATLAVRESERMREHSESEVIRTRREAMAESQQIREHFESEVMRMHREATVAVTESQKLLDKQAEDLKRDSARIRQHYLDEARTIQIAASIRLRKL